MQGLVFWLETSWRSVQAVSRAQRGDCKRCVYPQVCVARQVQPGMVPGSHSLFHILRSCHCPGPRYRHWRVPSHGPWSLYRATAHSLSEGETEALFRKEPGRRRCPGVTVEQMQMFTDWIGSSTGALSFVFEVRRVDVCRRALWTAI